MAGIIVKEIATVKGEMKMMGDRGRGWKWKRFVFVLCAVGFLVCEASRVNAQQEEPVWKWTPEQI
jgi:hypothetical protein